MITRSVKVYLRMKREDKGKSWMLTRWEKLLLGSVYLFGGVIFGILFGSIAGYLLSILNITSFMNGFMYVFLVPILIRLAILLSGSIFKKTEDFLKEKFSDAVH